MNKTERFLFDLLRDAGSRLLKHYGRVKTIQLKLGAATNLVTNADQDIEQFIKNRIRKEFPHDTILAEESDIENPNTPRKWIIDPLDGTTNFAHSFPIFCISVALEVKGRLEIGGVFNPVLNEFFFAKKNQGARLNGKKITVSRISRLEKALLATGFPYDIHDHPEHSLPYFNAMIRKAQGVRRNGSAALDLCHLAMGRFDGFFEVQLHPWDTAAGILILREAGGIATDFEGRPFSIYNKEIAASNGRIQDEILRVLKTVKSDQLKEVAL